MTRREALAALLSAPLLHVSRLRGQSDDLTALTIAEASRRLASRSITPVQLTNAYLSRIAALNKRLNAYVTVTADLARREANALGKPTGPMWGIPIAHKDLLETKGVLSTAGSLLFEQHIPDANAAIVQQLHDAGAVMLGKTNTHELGGGTTTINPFYGITRNPVDEARIPGGSSGGSAAAVVARLCAAATGSDTGGSVRIPAALCGCVGYKPTFGKFSTRGLLGASPSFDHVGFLTRTVEDAQIIAGLSRQTVTTTAKIAVARNFFFNNLEPAVAAAVDVAVAKYSDIQFPVDAKIRTGVFDPIFLFELWHRWGPDWRTDPGKFSKQFAGVFSTPRPSVAQYEECLAALKEYQNAVDKLFDSVDVVVMPTVRSTAALIADPTAGAGLVRNCWPFNAAGTPAISIPLKSSGLPVGLQLVARRGEDDKLLQIARLFEGP